jgi:hypothetical protein
MATPPKETHLDDSQIESFCLGKIPAPELADLEEHLLTCESCQQRVTDGDEYVRSMRNASSRFRSEEQKPRKAWAASGLVPVLGATLAVGGFATYLIMAHHGSGPRVPVALDATRDAAVPAQAPADRPLLLNPGLDGLPQLAAYRLEMVDLNGKRVFQADYIPGKGVETPAQASGVYFVRLYTFQTTLLREYALELQAGNNTVHTSEQ